MLLEGDDGRAGHALAALAARARAERELAALTLRARLVGGAPAADGQAPTAARSGRERDGASAPASA